jgi:DNA (cytosine-5)-methyltransferase 1
MSNSFTYVDLFAGIGGFKMALDAQGGISSGFSEIAPDAISAYTENYECDESENLGDITKIKNLPEHDILVAGVPCQSWSIAGKNLGFDDDRGQLWNDTLYLLNKSKPKCFIFENVKGLADPRNKESLSYIMQRISDAGYFGGYYVLNSQDYGVPQNRIRIYIVGFRNKEHFKKFVLPDKAELSPSLDKIFHLETGSYQQDTIKQLDFFGKTALKKGGSISSTNGFNDYFLFNDIRNGKTTVHSWDIIDTTEKQKQICFSLLKNRRKSQYGPLDGNPMSLKQLRNIDDTITQVDLTELVGIELLKEISYEFEIISCNENLSETEEIFLNECKGSTFVIDELKTNRNLRIRKISINETIYGLLNKRIISCIQVRYDFKNTKISSGLFGINRIFMPSAKTFSTLVASDTIDYIATKRIFPENDKDYKEQFLNEIYFKNNYRKITKEEACLIQGFPQNFILPNNRARWMKLIGNSVSIPVIESLVIAIKQTGALSSANYSNTKLDHKESVAIG